MRKSLETPSLGNVLRLLGSRLNFFKGESRRSYQKAYSSFQIYVVGNYSPNIILENSVVENWIVYNFIQGLSSKTISFYLDKIASLYSGVAHKLSGGKTSLFKEVKKKLKDFKPELDYSAFIKKVSKKVKSLHSKCLHLHQDCSIVEALIRFPGDKDKPVKESIKILWGCVALYAGVLPDIVKGIIGNSRINLGLLNLCSPKIVTAEDIKKAEKCVSESLKGEEPQWFAMRLRPKVKFDGLLERFAELSSSIKMPELFYPNEEIVKRVGRKVVWKGKPIIRDVVFFKWHKSEIYPLFTKLNDLAWCYRTPGEGVGNYAAIPSKAMEDFKNALGLLSPDFEVAPAGEMELKPGEKVVIVGGDYAQELAEILKKPTETSEGNKIYRVSLLNSNGHWDIGIDARLLKKA